MCKICSQDNLLCWNYDKIKLKSFIHKILDLFSINKIILFGSVARGDYNENSDIDLIFVGNFKDRFFDRIGKILDFVPKDLEIEPLIYTNEEFEKMLKNENPFILRVIAEGINLI